MNDSLRADGGRPALRAPDTVRFWLHLEGLAAFVAGVALFASMGGDLVWFALFLLAPDLSMVGYAADRAVGAFTYNLVHNWAVGLGVIGLGLALSIPALSLAGAIVVAHVGIDRLLGYGLKHNTGFKDTHLQRA